MQSGIHNMIKKDIVYCTHNNDKISSELSCGMKRKIKNDKAFQKEKEKKRLFTSLICSSNKYSKYNK